MTDSDTPQKRAPMATQDLENAYQRALQQLSTLQQGRYAYAEDWNVLADYARAIIDVLLDWLGKLYARGCTYCADIYNRVLECRHILSTYEYLKTGDTIMPKHTNTLIDVTKCLDEVSELLPVMHFETDVARGLDEVVWKYPTVGEIVLVDVDDWNTAKRYVTDGTIIFVNYGTQAMTSEEVREIVNTMNVVFAILIDTQPYYGGDVGAFYDVFYTSRRPSRRCGPFGCVRFVDDEFNRHFGFYGCVNPRCAIPAAWDYGVHLMHKVSHAKPWAYGNCGYAYAKYGAGAIIELPFDGVWDSVDSLDFTIGMIANRLLGEENACHISSRATKLRRIVWMASYYPGPGVIHLCSSADRCLEQLASKSGWRLIDLRKR